MGSINNSNTDKSTKSYLAGYENCPEVLKPTPLAVKGAIPPWLEGSLYRSGPGTWDLTSDDGNDVSFQSWFDGLAQIHRYEIQKGGTASYRSRNTCNDLRERIQTTEEISGLTFCQRDPCKTTFQKFVTIFKKAVSGSPSMSGTGINIPVISIPNFPGLVERDGDKAAESAAKNSNLHNLVVSADSGILQELDPVTLEPIQYLAYGDVCESLKSYGLTPAHPCVDPDTGDFYQVLLAFGKTAVYKVVCIKQPLEGPSREPEVKVLAQIKSPRPTYIHSFFMTKRYVVLAHWQCDFAAWGMSVFWYGNAFDSFNHHDPNVKSSFYVVDRQEGRHVATFECDPYFAFHTINGFDDGDDIVLDLAAYKDHSVIRDSQLENLRDEINGKAPQQPAFRRYRLSNVSKQASLSGAVNHAPKPVPAHIDFELNPSIGFELPSINPGNYTREYRYAFGVNISGENRTTAYDRIIKVDLDKLSSGDQVNSVKFWIEDQCTPSEPVFVPTPNGTEEDDGVLLSIVLDGRRRTGFLLVLSAQTMEKIARAEMPEGKVAPYNFHGVFVSSN
ncbi:hypothetical protein BGX26_009476 [Mortierella sp. AD094]|nr:hypothetical protein BGX26_009476 [Mortierella sp. AD094]